MKHRVSLVTFGLSAPERMNMFKSLITALVQHERIVTTLAKAKEVRKFADKVVTYGKKGTKISYDRTQRLIRDPTLIPKVFEDLAERYKDRHGGYTRVLRLGPRKGDGAEMAVLEYVDSPLGNLLSPAKEGLAEKRKAKEN